MMVETPVTFESQRLTGVGAAVVSSHGRRWPGFTRRSIRALTGIPSITAKMFTIHLFNSVQAFSVMVTESMVISSFG